MELPTHGAVARSWSAVVRGAAALFVGAAWCGAASVAGAQGVGPIAVDGEFGDWGGAAASLVDAGGDAAGGLDLRSIWAVGAGSELALRVRLGAVTNLPSGPPSEGTLRLLIDLPDGDRLNIDLRGRRAFLGSVPTVALRWAAFRFRSAPTYAADEFEIGMDLSAYGVAEGSTVGVSFAGSDAIDAPIALRFAPAWPDPPRRSPGRAAGTEWRIASMNTLFDGISPTSTRLAPISRLLRGVNAEVVCLQEQYSTSASYLGGALAEIHDGPGAPAWNAVKQGDNVVASRSSLTPIPTSTSSAAAGAVVELPSGPVAVFSIHPSCCGYIGSTSDVNRIAQMNALIAVIAGLRARTLGPALAPFADAPIVVIGDWNLVGSRTPLDLISARPGPGLREVRLRRLASTEMFTWRDDPSSFWPGRLDLMAASPRELRTVGSFVLDTEELRPDELAALGVQRTDSDASDHLLLVADFAGPCAADFDDGNGAGSPDGAVTLDDLLYYLALYESGAIEADMDDGTGSGQPDNGVTLDDLLYYLVRYDAGC